MKIICISGKARHGKDVTAGILKKILEEKGMRVLITHYGDLLKYICSSFFGWNGKKDKAGRDLLQYIGTNNIRDKEPDYWVNFVAGVLRIFPQWWDYVLIPDCRFPNEIDVMRDIFKDDVTHLRIVRFDYDPNENRWAPFDNGLTEEQKNHISETALDHVKPNLTLYNFGTYERYEQYIRSVVPMTIFKE